MSTLERTAALIATAALALTAACGGTAEEEAAPSASVSSSPTTEQPTPTEVPDEDALTTALLTVDDLGDGWMELGLGGESAPPGLGLPCPDDAELPEALQWQVGTRLTLDNDATEGRYSPPMLDEYLLASDPAELEQLYLDVREALDACVGEDREGEGDAYMVTTTEVVDLDGAGDQALMRRLSDAAADSPGDAVLGEGRMVLVRSGATLMKLTLYEAGHVSQYTGQELDLVITDADLDGIVATALAKLG